MTPAIAIRSTPDGRIQARRLDGRPLTPEDREEAKRIAASIQTPVTDPGALIDGDVQAVLIESEVLGSPIWFALIDGWTPEQGDKTPVFYASELPALRQMSEAELRRRYTEKQIFGSGWIRAKIDNVTRH